MTDIQTLLNPLKQLQAKIRDAVVAACEQATFDELSRVAYEAPEDTIYAIDRISEEVLLDFFAQEIAPLAPLVLIAEGLPEGQMVLPLGTPEDEAVWRIIIDPIDGTRGLMFQKRSAWVLTGVAPNRGPETSLADIALAVQTEIPLVKQHLSDVLWALEGQGAQAERFNRLTGEQAPLKLSPSTAGTLTHGFATVARFFPGSREALGAIDDELMRSALGTIQPGHAACFEDQYPSSGGQLYELMTGHDRFVADLRPLLEPLLKKRGQAMGLCAHPYDLCTELIARELGVIVTDPHGELLHDPLDVRSNVGWVGYANEALREQLEPLLQTALRRRNLL